MNMHQMHLQTNNVESKGYTAEDARVIAKIIYTLNSRVNMQEHKVGNSFAQAYSLAKGVKQFGKKEKEAAMKVIKELDNRDVFGPIRVENLSILERKRAIESLIFLPEKRDGTIKGRTLTNGSTQRSYVDRDKAASPIATTESQIITASIDAYQGRYVMTADKPNKFVHTHVGKKEKGERIVMKICGALPGS